MKKIFLYSTLCFFILTESSLYSSAPAQSSALTRQDSIQFKNLSPEQEKLFLNALSNDTTDIISTFDSTVIEKNESAFTKTAIILHNKSFFDYFLNRISSANLQTKDDEEYSLLHVAAEVGNTNAIQILLEKGLSATDKTLTTGRTSLHVAYQAPSVFYEKFDPQVVQLLVKNNPDLVNELDASGRTALHYAVLGDNSDMLKELLAQGANPAIKDKNDYSALDYAVLNRNAIAFETLMDNVSHYSHNPHGPACNHFNTSKNIFLKLISGRQYNLDSKQSLSLKHPFSPEYIGNLLLIAVKSKIDSPSIVILLLENGVDIKVTCPDGATPLHYAAGYNHIKVIKVLLAADSDINAKKLDGATPLHEAADKGNIEAVKVLLEAGADKNAKTARGITPIQKAIASGHIKIVEEFIAAQADLKSIDIDGDTSLHEAAIKGDIEIVKSLLDAGSDINAKNNKGLTPLFFAVSKGHLEVFKELLLRHADINAISKEFLLCIATEKGYTEIVEKLLSLGANPNITKEKDGNSLLHIAAEKGFVEIVKILLTVGVNPNVINKDGLTPVYLAAENEHFTTVKELFSARAHQGIKTKNIRTPLYDAVCKGSLEKVKALLAAGADPNEQASKDDQYTPLHQATRAGNIPMVKALLAAGACARRTVYDINPLYIAMKSPHPNPELIKLLQDAYDPSCIIQ